MAQGQIVRPASILQAVGGVWPVGWCKSLASADGKPIGYPSFNANPFFKGPRHEKTRSDSITAAVHAFQAGTFAVPDYVTLRECDLPFWRSAVACRNDWKEAELFMVAVLARALADSERLHREIADEGEIIDGRPNLKFALVETLSRRAMSLTRHLQIHARATRGEARQVARLAVVPTGDDNPLIPRLPRQ